MTAQIIDLHIYRIQKALARQQRDPTASYNDAWMRMTYPNKLTVRPANKITLKDSNEPANPPTEEPDY